MPPGSGATTWRARNRSTSRGSATLRRALQAAAAVVAALVICAAVNWSLLARTQWLVLRHDSTTDVWLPAADTQHLSLEQLPPQRMLSVSFVSKKRLNEFVRFWPSHLANYSAHQANHSWLIAYPNTDANVLLQVPASQNWTPSAVVTHEHTFTHGPLRLFVTPDGQRVMMQGMAVHLPATFLDHQTVPHCHKRDWSLSYALYSGAVFSYHLIKLPLLQKFEVMVKVDTDIEATAPFPDLGAAMEAKGCSVGHTTLHDTNDCEADSLPALQAFVKRRRRGPAASWRYGWCGGRMIQNMTAPSKLFYGNLVAYSTQLLLDPDVQDLSTFLYEEWPAGYFLRRWGDQAPFMLYLCLKDDVPDLFSSKALCDFSGLRNKVFKHW